MAVGDALKRIPPAYWVARRVRTALGDLLPARSLAEVPGPVHRNDVMYASATGGAEYAATGTAAALFVVDALAAAGLRPTRGLDLGCGHGRVLRHLVDEVPVPWTACDLDRSAVRFCTRAFGATAVVARRPLRTTAFPAEPYDVVWMGSVVTHLAAADEREVWATLDAITAPEAVVALSILRPGMVNNLESFGTGMGASAHQVAADLEADGFAYVPYPHHRRGDYGVAFHDPDRLLGRVESASGRRAELLLHAPGAWEGMQDYVALRVTRR